MSTLARVAYREVTMTSPPLYIGSMTLTRGTGRSLAVARHAAPLVVVGALILAWELTEAQVHVRSPAVPAPSAILRTLFLERDLFWKSLQPTLYEATLGFVLGNAFAILLAALLVRWPAFEVSILQVSLTMHSLPIVAIAPLLVLWLGTGYAPRVAIAALSCFFPTVVNAARGFSALDRETSDLMNVLAASPRQVFLKARVPFATPYLFAAFKIGAPAAVVGAVLGEWIGAEQGLGLLMLWAMFTHLVPRLWATVLVSAVVAATAYAVTAVSERMIAPWAVDLPTTS
jgi:NitT/TauT family transport system permease protein